MPQRLLPLLTAHPQTGEALGLRVGVNRVSINTLAKRLIEEGIPLEISRAGYALAAGTPAPQLTQRTGQLGKDMLYFGTVGSTQDTLRAWADAEIKETAGHGAVVVAERQTAGRGRRGRVWDTTHGTLVFSLLLLGDQAGLSLSLVDLALMPLAVGVALQKACGLGGLKWPNDLLAPDRRKLAGILIEADLRGEEARRAVIGIGLNVTAAPPGAAHLSEFRPEVTRAMLLGQILQELEYWLSAPATEVLAAWQAVNVTLGQAVSVQTVRGLIEGTAHSLDIHGNLLVQPTTELPQTELPQAELPQAGLITVSAGDVQLVGLLPEIPPIPLLNT